MTTPLSNFADRGIVLALAGTPTGLTYNDRGGRTQPFGTLGTSYADNTTTAPQTAPHFASTGSGYTAHVHIVFANSSEPNITVRLTAQRIDKQNPNLFGPAEVSTVRNDGQSPAVASEQVFSAANGVNPGDGTSVIDAILQTPNSYCAGQLVWSAKAAGSPAAGTKIVLAVTA